MRNPTLSIAISIAAAAAAAACTSTSEPEGDEPEELIHVTPSGADTGACTSAAPCRTLSYALGQVAPSRNVIRVVGGLVTAATISIDQPVVIDASGTTIGKPSHRPTFHIGPHAGTVTLEGLNLVGVPEPGEPTITVARGSTLRIARSLLDTAVLELDGGALELADVRLITSLPRVQAVQCSAGTVRARGVEFEHTTITAMNCHLNVSRSRFDEIVDGSINAFGGVAVVENNLVVQAYELADTMYLAGMGPGSAVRFNTFVNTAGVASDGVALSCDDTLDVTSNLFAYGSAHPLGPPLVRCPARFSLFDTVAAPEQVVGEGNRIASARAFFVDRAAGDFHLACGSPAKDAAEPSLAVTEDLEGRPRPSPAGTRADIGAFEAQGAFEAP